MEGITFRSYEFLNLSQDDAMIRTLTELDDDDVVYDIGANVGHYAIPAAKQASEVHTFEANPHLIDKLRMNVGVNALENIVIHEYGLSDAATNLTFYISSDHSQSSFNRHAATNQGEHIVDEVSVTLKTVDDLAEESPPTVLKIDVEGHELPVLKGAENTLMEHRPTVYVECHQVGEDDSTDDSIREYLNRYGYEVTKKQNAFFGEPS